MKKILLTALAATAITTGAFAQGSINLSDNLPVQPGVATDNATAWVTGSVTFQIWWLAAGAPNANYITGINAADLAGKGANAVALVSADGFTDELNGLVCAVNGGGFTYNGTGVALPGITTSTVNTFALVATWNNNGVLYSGAIAFNNPDGGNLGGTPAGTPAGLDQGWNSINQNLILSPAAVPEPTTMALAGLGSLSLFLFRRRK